MIPQIEWVYLLWMATKWFCIFVKVGARMQPKTIEPLLWASPCAGHMPAQDFIWYQPHIRDTEVKNPPANAGDADLIPGLGRSPGVGNDNLLQYSCLENPHGQRSLADYSPWSCKSLTWQSIHTHTHRIKKIRNLIPLEKSSEKVIDLTIWSYHTTHFWMIKPLC